MRITAVDIGNSRTHIATFERGRIVSRGKVDGDVVAYASVNPRAEKRWRKAQKMGRDFPPAIANRYRPPSAAGMDRLANAAAAWARARRACVVIDLGTAITVDVVRDGAFVGGMIAPGWGLQAGALHEHTALLPRATPKRRLSFGRGTIESIEAGISFGVAGLIDAVRREFGRAVLFGTGGDVALFADLVDEVVPDLTLEGIAISYAASR
jgi:type III pantothenate kinase